MVKKIIGGCTVIFLVISLASFSLAAGIHKEDSNEIEDLKEFEIGMDPIFLNNPILSGNQIVNIENKELSSEEIEESIKCIEEGEHIDADINASLQSVTFLNGETYNILSADTKESSKEKRFDDVILKGTIAWIDRFGPNNYLRWVSGSRTGQYDGKGNKEALCFYLTIYSNTKSGKEVKLVINNMIWD